MLCCVHMPALIYVLCDGPTLLELASESWRYQATCGHDEGSLYNVGIQEGSDCAQMFLTVWCLAVV